jgi:hypothetical protein
VSANLNNNTGAPGPEIRESCNTGFVTTFFAQRLTSVRYPNAICLRKRTRVLVPVIHDTTKCVPSGTNVNQRRRCTRCRTKVGQQRGRKP